MTFAVNMKLHLIHQSTKAVRFTSGVVCEINLPNYLLGTLLYIAAHLGRDTEGTLLLISACPGSAKGYLVSCSKPRTSDERSWFIITAARNNAWCVCIHMYCAVKVAVVEADAFLSLLGSEIVNSR